MVKYVAIDIGRNEVKTFIGNNDPLFFASRVGGWHQRKVSEGGRYEAEINGKKYFVADLVKQSYTPREMASDSKCHLETNILFLTALSLLVESETNFKIVTGLPISHYTPAGKADMMNLLSGYHKVTIGGKTSMFNISQDNLEFTYEAGGAFWDEVLDMDCGIANMEMYNNTVRTIDIGSRTINYCTTTEGEFLDKDSDTLPYGTIELDNMSDSPDDYIKEAFCRRIAADLSKKWLNYKPKSDIILLTGGGSSLLGSFIKPHFGKVVFAKNPKFGNVRGFYKMLKAKYDA